jgi:hypothetical protein
VGGVPFLKAKLPLPTEEQHKLHHLYTPADLGSVQILLFYYFINFSAVDPHLVVGSE